MKKMNQPKVAPKQTRSIEPLRFGDLVFGEFPFPDGGSKNRWVFAVEDLGDSVLVCYCTTNPEWKNSVRLGCLQDGKVTHLVPQRWEVVSKMRLAVGRVQRVPMPIPGIGTEVLQWMSVMSKAGIQGNAAGFPVAQAQNLMSQVGHYKMIAEGQGRKIAERRNALRK